MNVFTKHIVTNYQNVYLHPNKDKTNVTELYVILKSHPNI